LQKKGSRLGCPFWHQPTFEMKFLLLLSGALALTTSLALAQTAVPANVPGALPVTPPNATSAGSPRGHSRDQEAPGLDRHDKKRLRKINKVKPSPSEQPKA
jgi:hypothetical protein